MDDAESWDAESLIACGIEAQEVRGDLRDGRRWFEAGYQRAERAGDVTSMARAVLGLGGVWVHEHRTAVASGLMRARLENVLGLLDPASALGLRVRARLAGESDYRNGTHDLILTVLAEARKSPDPVVRVDALSFAHHCLLGPGYGVLRRAIADEMIVEATRSGRRSDLLRGLLWQVADLFMDGDPHAERRLGELRAMLAEGEHLAVGYVARAMDVMLATRAGQFEKAEQLALEACELGTAAGDADAGAWYGAQLVVIRWYQGRLPELLPLLTELVHSPTLSAVDNSYFGALAVAAATAGDHRTASGALAKLRGRALTELPMSSSWLITMYGLVEAAHMLDDGYAAGLAYELLLPYADLPMVASLGVACFGSVHHALGVASLTVGEVDRALKHLCEAIDANLALGHWPAAIASRLRYAEARERRGLPDDDKVAYAQRLLAEEMSVGLGVVVEPGGSLTATAEARAAVCTRQGRKWRVELGSRSALVDHSVGMLHLAVLIANPGVEITAVDLAAGVDALGQAARNAAMPAQPVLDRASVQRYRQRLAQLDDQIDDMEERGDGARAARARTEREWLLAELASATGLGGRARAFADNGERARLAVGKAIRRAIANVEATDPVVGAHLRGGVHTGIRCWYRPL